MGMLSDEDKHFLAVQNCDALLMTLDELKKENDKLRLVIEMYKRRIYEYALEGYLNGYRYFIQDLENKEKEILNIKEGEK
jgi:hypothetical protein